MLLKKYETGTNDFPYLKSVHLGGYYKSWGLLGKILGIYLHLSSDINILVIITLPQTQAFLKYAAELFLLLRRLLLCILPSGR